MIVALTGMRAGVRILSMKRNVRFLKRGVFCILCGWAVGVFGMLQYDDLHGAKDAGDTTNGGFWTIEREPLALVACESKISVAVDGCARSTAVAEEPDQVDGCVRTQDDSGAIMLRTDPPSGLCVIFR